MALLGFFRFWIVLWKNDDGLDGGGRVVRAPCMRLVGPDPQPTNPSSKSFLALAGR